MGCKGKSAHARGHVVPRHGVCAFVPTCWLQLGYHASKEAFGHVWDMHISAGEGGPNFTVGSTSATAW